MLESGGLIGELKKALAERMLNAGMDVHLAQEADAGLANHRNGSSGKMVLTPDGTLELSILLFAARHIRIAWRILERVSKQRRS